jgi:RNA polymerase sigma-70 factor (ECF subfamily)
MLLGQEMKLRFRQIPPQFEIDLSEYLDALYSYGLVLSRNRADAEDLVQDTMLKAYSQFRSFHEGTHLKAWLLRIMYNTWINNHRKTRRRPTEQLSAEITDWQEAHQRHIPAGCRSAEVQALEALPDRATTEALDALPESFRATVYYADVHGYRYREIAEIMNVPVGTVTSRLHNARRRLRESLVDSAH